MAPENQEWTSKHIWRIMLCKCILPGTADLNAYVLSNTLMLPTLVACLFAFISSSTLSATEYFVSTTGSDALVGTPQSNAWLTIQHAVDSVGPGDTITVLAGTYAGAIIGSQGLPDAPIVLRADPGQSVHLNSLGPSYAQQQHPSILLFEGWYTGLAPAYWTVEGFEISSAPRDGIDLRGTGYDTPVHHITIRSNNIHHCQNRAIMTIWADDCVVEYNECSYSGNEHGIYFSEGGDRITLRGNICHHNNACGIQVNAGRGDYQGESTGCLIERNVLFENGVIGGAGLNLGGVTESLIANNLIYANHKGSGVAVYKDVYSVVPRDIQLLNNTVICAGEGSGRWAVNVSSPDATDIVLLNNIILNNSAVDGSITMADPTNIGILSDDNVVMDRFSINEGGSIMSLSEWQAAYSHDMNSVIASAEQLFVNAPAEDYHLSPTSLAIDVGMVLATVSNDLDLLTRPQGITHDAGAYEYPSSLLRIAASAHAGGQVVPDGVVLSEPGTNVTFSITNSPGYRTVSVISDEGTIQETNHGAVASHTFMNVQTNHTLDAYFTNIFSVTPIAGAGGTITPSTAVTADIGQSVAFDIAADEHWHIARIRVNSVEINAFTETNRLATAHISWSNLVADSTLEASFAENIWEQSVPQVWLAEHYPGSNDYEGVALTDTDADRFEAWEEYMAGTDPRDPKSRFRVIEAGRTNLTNFIRWLGSSDGSPAPFGIYRSTNMGSTGNVWSFMTNHSKTQSRTNTWFDPAASNLPAFYRITVQD